MELVVEVDTIRKVEWVRTWKEKKSYQGLW